jgi:hypothetical protein
MRQLLIRNPGALENIVRDYETVEPEGRGPRSPAHPEELLQFLALDPAAFDLDAIRAASPQVPDITSDQFTDEDREAVERLVALGFSRERAIQSNPLVCMALDGGGHGGG